ncbi:hypothetical protein ES319_A05G432400v1 [Gossypium barbadense]|uniref:PORR domain-containing protein n=1 Tax=Gossypium barbadense TaxID=3634 RepID=A0A5J5W0L2_GOSBA|nr:hypothetical protein ES319_A05G432400v1 [Gossypium barbadense]
MFFHNSYFTTHFGNLFFCSKISVFSLFDHQKSPFRYTQISNYVNVYMKWKKDPFFDSILHIHKSAELKPIIQLKNFIVNYPNGCIPISSVSKRGLEFDISIRVARFLRQYPSVFEEFRGEHNLPWFRLTPEAAEIDREEKRVLEECKEDLKDRLKRFVLMSKDKVLPLKIIKGMAWYLGLPERFLDDSKGDLLDESFRFVDMEDGLKGLTVESNGEKVLSTMQRNAIKNGVYFGGTLEGIEFPLFPSKGLRLRRKIESWLNEFQKLPYVSPYEDFWHLDPDSDFAEKRVVGILHELLSLFVEHSAERKKLLCLKKYFGLPQKVHKAFERHPHMFYLSFKNKTCTAILKEAYCGNSSIEKHPMLVVRKKYIRLVKESDRILKNRKINNRFIKHEKLEKGSDIDANSDDRTDIQAQEVSKSFHIVTNYSSQEWLVLDLLPHSSIPFVDIIFLIEKRSRLGFEK